MARKASKPVEHSEIIGPKHPMYEQLQHEDWLAEGAPEWHDLYGELRRLRASTETGEPVAVPLSEWMTVGEVAEAFRWSAKTVRADIRDGKLPASGGGKGSKYRIRRDDAQLWASARRSPAKQHPKRPARTLRPAATSSTFKDLARKAK